MKRATQSSLQSAGDRVRAIVSAILLPCLIWQPSMAAGVSVAAGQGQRTTVTQAANGVPLVNIAAPNASGLSHNLYQNFNVNPQGLILNNATHVSKTQLGGYVQANPHLGKGSASVILNEVTSRNPSLLNGYMEVAGKQANVIVANPNGITCDGCGFINTSRATLTTGNAFFDTKGGLEGFDVQAGQIDFDNQGMIAKNVDQFDVLSRAVKINAKIHADQLNIVTGKQKVDYATLSTSEQPTDSKAPTVAIDSTALGGIYANRISLTSTEQGVGVNLKAPVAALTGDVTLSVDGKLSYTQVSAETDIALQAKEVESKGLTLAKGTLSIDAEQLDLQAGSMTAEDVDVALTGNMQVSQDAVLAANDDIKVTAQDVTNKGLIYAADDINVYLPGRFTNGDNSATAATRGAAVYAGGDLSISGVEGGQAAVVDNFASVLQAGGDINLQAAQVNNVRLFWEIGNRQVGVPTSKTLRTHDGDGEWAKIYNYQDYVVEAGVQARIEAGGNINVQGDVLNDKSTIIAGQDITIDGSFEFPGYNLKGQKKYVVYDVDCDDFDFGDCESYEWTWDREPALDERYSYDYAVGQALPSATVAGGTFKVDGEKFENSGSVATAVGAQIQKPSTDLDALLYSALYNVNTNPDSPYLIESRYQYATLDGFKGSEYMLQQLGWLPDGTTKLLGDGFAELTWMRQNLIASGKPMVAALDNEALAKEYAGWVSNGLYASEALQLTPGISLTPEQVNSLTQDIIWPVKKTIAGVTVMVPTLYIAGGAQLNNQGSLIAANNIDINANSIATGGRLQALQDISLRGDNIRMNGGSVAAGRDLRVDANHDLGILSVAMNANNIDLHAGNNLMLATAAETDGFDANGIKVWETFVGQQASLNASGKLNISSGNDLAINGAALTGGQVSLDAGHDLTLGAVADDDGHDFSGGDYRDTQRSVRHLVTSITSTLDTLMKAGNDITLLGSEVTAGRDLQLGAKNNITIANVTDSDYHFHQESQDKWYGSKTKTSTDYDENIIGPKLSAGGDLLINTHKNKYGKIIKNADAKGDVLLVSADLDAKGDAAIYAGKDLTIGVDREAHYHASKTTRSYSGLAKGMMAAVSVAAMGILPPTMSAAGWSHGVTIKGDEGAGKSQQKVVRSSLTAAGNTSLWSGRDITLVAPELKLNNLNAEAGLDKSAGKGNIWLTGAHDTNESWSYESSTTLGVQASGGSLSFARQHEHRERDSSRTFVGTSVNTAGNARLKSAGDTTLLGSSLNSEGAVSITTGGDFNMLTAVNSSRHEETNVERDFKIEASASKHSAELFAGYEENRHTETSTQREAVGSSVNADNIKINSGKDINVVGSSLNANYDPTATTYGFMLSPHGEKVAVAYNDSGNITLDAKRDINTLASVSEDSLKTIDEQLRSGLAIGAKENVSAAADAVGNVKGQKGGVNTASAGLQAVDAMQAARSKPSVSVGLVAEWSKTESEDSNKTAKVSTIHADNNLAFISGGDQHHQGTQADAYNNLTIDAGGKVLIESAQDTSNHKDKSENGSLNVGLSSGNGYNVTAAGGYARNSNEQTQQVNAHFEAGNKVDLTTGGDTTLAGATVKADSIDAHIGGNLTVASRQDTGSIRGESAQVSVTVGTGSGGASLSGSHTKGDSAWVQEQSGLFASGKNNVYVDKHTKLVGGVINSDSGDTQLNTGSLSYEDVHDYDRFKSMSASVGIGTSQGNVGSSGGTANQQAPSGTKINNAQIGYQKRDREQITRATVGQGNITVRDDQANGADSTAGLNRNIKRAQQITKDEDKSYNLYASDSSLKGIGALKKNDKADNSSRLQQLKDTLNIGLATSEIVETGIRGVDQVDNALFTGFSLGLAQPDKRGNMGLLKDSDVNKWAGMAGDGVLAVSDAVVNKDHEGNWHLFDIGTKATTTDHYTRNQDARLKQEAIYQTLAAQKQGALNSKKDLVDLVNNLTDHDAAQSEKILSYIASQIANGDIKVGFYDANGGLAAAGAAFSNGKEGAAGLNTDKLNLRDPRAYMSALGEEGYHLRDGSDDGYANLYGDRFGYLWERANEQEGRSTGGSITQADWMAKNHESLAANDAAYRTQRPSQMEFRAFRLNEATALEAVRQEIRTNPSLTEQQKSIAILKAEAKACAATRCAESLPDSDELKQTYAQLQSFGDALVKAEGGIQQDLAAAGLENTEELFKYNFVDRAGDYYNNHEEIVVRTGGFVEATGSAVGMFGGATTAIAGVAGCGPSLGLSCVLVPAGGALFAVSWQGAKDGISTALGDYHSLQGKRVADSFSPATHPGDYNPLGSIAEDAGLYVVERATEKVGGKFIGPRIEQYLGVGEDSAKAVGKQSRSPGQTAADGELNAQKALDDQLKESPTSPVSRDSGSESNVVRVNTQNATVKNSPDYDALNNSTPNTRYELDNGTTFRTNSDGHVEEITYSPVDLKMPRDSRQTAVGHEGLDTDVGGHIQACSMGGTCDRYNLFPQDKNFNNGEYKKWENEIRNALQNGDKVGPVTVRFGRANPNSSRPDSLDIEYTINGTVYTREFRNQPGG